MSESTVTDKAPKYLIPTYGKGKELCDLLRAELSIPETASRFSVTFEIGELISVSCDYLPRTRSD